MTDKDNPFGKGHDHGDKNFNPEKHSEKEQRNELSLPDFEYTPPTPSTPPPASGNGGANQGQVESSSGDQ